MGVAGEHGAWPLAVFDPVTLGRFRLGSILISRSVPTGRRVRFVDFSWVCRFVAAEARHGPTDGLHVVQ